MGFESLLIGVSPDSVEQDWGETHHVAPYQATTGHPQSAGELGGELFLHPPAIPRI